MPENNPRIRRLLIDCDIERYSKRDDPGQREAQRGLIELLKNSCEDAEIDRSLWSTQPQGDGELAVLPSGLDEGKVISSIFHAMKINLYRYNQKLNDEYRIRMRVCVHQGITQIADAGVVGQATVHVDRLLNAPQAKRALADNRRADIILIVSQSIYDEVIRHYESEPRADQFEQIRVTIPDKEFDDVAWVHVPERDVPAPVAPADTGPASAVGSARGKRLVHTDNRVFGGGNQIRSGRDTALGDIHNG